MMNKWLNIIPKAAACRKRRSPNTDKRDSDILVRFVKRQHDDEFPFDGAGGTIGHAVYPDPLTGKN